MVRRWCQSRVRRHLARGMLVAVVMALAATPPVLAWLLAGALTGIHYVSDSYPLRIVAVHAAGTRGVPEAMTAAVTLTDGPDAAEPGVFRLAWPGGHGLVGPVLEHREGRVTRVFTALTGSPAVGVRAGIEPDRYTGTPADDLGLPFGIVDVPAAVGPLPAWFIPAATAPAPNRSWVLLVHGLGGSRTDTLPVMRTWHQLGFPILAVTYRNDAGAPASADRRSHLGLTEWQDLDAAVGYATAHGAPDVIIEGFSLGGTLALLAADHGAHRSSITALVLDSPMLDWRDTLALTTGPPIANLICQGLSWRADDPCAQITAGQSAADIHVPTLLIQGSADRVVPAANAVEVRSLRPNLVTLRIVTGADHVSAIDTDPAGYTNAVTQFTGTIHR